MDTRSPKLKPVQGILLLFLLLVVPITGYFVAEKTNNFSNWSFAKGMHTGSAVRVQVSPELCASEAIKRQLNCKAGEAPAVVNVSTAGSSKSKSKPTPTCRCQPIPSGGAALTGAGGASPTPTGSIAQRCNAGCTDDAACGEGMVCTQIGGVGKCRNSQCYGIDDCWCFKVTSPSPGPSCNSSCTTDGDCGTSLICVKTANGNKCRNPQCYGTEDCLCYSTLVTPTPQGVVGPTPTTYLTPTPIDTYYVDQYQPVQPTIRRTPTPYPTPTLAPILLADILALSPTPTPFPAVEQVAAPSLTIDQFYNAKKQTNPMISLSGTSNADADLDISITPDNIMTTVTADSMGNWTYVVPKKLTNGNKQLTVIVRLATGGQTTKTETFTVVGGFQFPFAAVVFSLLIALGVGGYIFYQKKIAAKNAAPAVDQYSSTTPTTFVPPEATPSEEQPTLQSVSQGETVSSPETNPASPVESTQPEPSATTPPETA